MLSITSPPEPLPGATCEAFGNPASLPFLHLCLSEHAKTDSLNRWTPSAVTIHKCLWFTFNSNSNIVNNAALCIKAIFLSCLQGLFVHSALGVSTVLRMIWHTYRKFRINFYAEFAMTDWWSKQWLNECQWNHHAHSLLRSHVACLVLLFLWLLLLVLQMTYYVPC